MELVLSALTSCSAVDIVNILKKKRKTVNDLVIQAEGVRREQTPQVLYGDYADFSFDVTGYHGGGV